MDRMNHALGSYVRYAFHAKHYPKSPFMTKEEPSRVFTRSEDLDAYINAHIEQEKQ
nr:MAG TPA: hypothetical protein [Caudoviricetes sp.]